MRKILFIVFLLVTSVTCAQTSTAAYVNVSYSNGRDFKSTDHLYHIVGAQFGSMLTDEWGLEIDYSYGIGDNNYNRLGINGIYQFINADPNVTPFIKFGVAHKTHNLNNNKEDHGCDIKLGGAVNIPIYNNMSTNLGINVSNCIWGDSKNGWSNTIFEIEVGINFMIY